MALLNLMFHHRIAIFGIENHFSLTKWPPLLSVASSTIARGGELGEAEGAIDPPILKVGSRAPPLFTVFNSLLLINNKLY